MSSALKRPRENDSTQLPAQKAPRPNRYTIEGLEVSILENKFVQQSLALDNKTQQIRLLNQKIKIFKNSQVQYESILASLGRAWQQSKLDQLPINSNKASKSNGSVNNQSDISPSQCFSQYFANPISVQPLLTLSSSLGTLPDEPFDLKNPNQFPDGHESSSLTPANSKDSIVAPSQALFSKVFSDNPCSKDEFNSLLDSALAPTRDAMTQLLKFLEGIANPESSGSSNSQSKDLTSLFKKYNTSLSKVQSDLVKWTSETSQLSDQHASVLRSALALENSNKNLFEDLIEAKLQIESLQNRLLESEARVSEFSSKNKHLAEQLEASHTSSTNSTKDNMDMSSDDDEGEDESNQDSDKLQNLKDLAQTRLEEIERLERIIGSTNQRLAQRAAQHKKTLMNLSVESVQSSAPYCALMKKVAYLNKTIDTYKKQLLLCKDEVKSTKSTLNTRVKEIESQLEEKLQLWYEKRKKTQEELNFAQETIIGLKQRLEHAQSAHRNRQGLVTQVQGMLKQFQQLNEDWKLNSDERIKLNSLETKVIALESSKNTDDIDETIGELSTACDDLATQLDTLSKSYSNLQDTNKNLTNLVQEKQDMFDKLLQERTKTAQYYETLKTQNAKLKSEALAADKVHSKLKEMGQSFSTQVSTLESKIKVHVEAERNLKLENETLRDRVQKLQEDIISHSTEKSNLEAFQEKQAAFLERRSDKINDLQKQLGRLQETINLQQKKIDRLRTAADEELEIELDELKRSQLCSLCSRRKRDTALQCGHVYCSACLEDMIRSRNRKCPGCMGMFSVNDRITLYLEDSVSQG